MANTDDFYRILGIERDASSAEIRAAYRQLARQMHPDVAGPDASIQFIRINRAYETLIDPRLRSDYDRQSRETRRPATRQAAVSPTWAGAPVFLNSLLADVLSTLAADGGGPATESAVRESAGAGSDQRIDVQPVHIEVVLTPDAARTGAQVRLELPVVTTCLNCRGSGLAAPFVCPACRGRGRWSDTRTVEFFLAPPIRDGQIVTLDLRSSNIPVGQISAHVRLSWL